MVGPSLDHLSQFRSPIYVAAAMWNHGPQMAETMKEKGIDRPTFTGNELRDLIAYLAPGTAGPQEGPVYALLGRPEAGRQLFAEKRCIECHAVGGVGGRVGPDLVARGVRQSPVEFATTIWNKAPAMAAAMKTRGITLPQLSPGEMADIVAYLYSVRYFGSAGNITNGWAVATQKGCLTCHAVSGERGKPASDLTKLQGPRLPGGGGRVAVEPRGRHASERHRRPEVGVADLQASRRWRTSSRCCSRSGESRPRRVADREGDRMIGRPPTP